MELFSVRRLQRLVALFALGTASIAFGGRLAQAQEWAWTRAEPARSGTTESGGLVVEPVAAGGAGIGGRLADTWVGDIVDVDGDGRSELILASAGRAFAWSGDGELVWETERRGIGAIVGAFDVTGDGDRELVAVGSELVLIELSSGNVLWSYENPTGSYFPDDVVVFDADGAGGQEILTGRRRGEDDVAVEMFRFDGGVFPDSPETNISWSATHDSFRHSIAIADIDRDDELEAVFAATLRTGPIVRDAASGVEESTFDVVRGGVHAGSYAGPIAAADLDGDLGIEIAVFGLRGDFADIWVRIYDPSSPEGAATAERYLASPPAEQWVPGNPVVDVNGDGRAELITSLWDGESWETLVLSYLPEAGTVSDAFVELASFPGTRVWDVRDFDGDGRAEIVLSEIGETTFVVPKVATVRGMEWDGVSWSEAWSAPGAAPALMYQRPEPSLHRYRQPVVGSVDSDGDGHDEILLVRDLDGNSLPESLALFDAERGENVHTVTLGTAGAAAFRLIAIGDGLSSADSTGDIVLVGGEGQARILTKELESIESEIPIRGFVSSPAAVDLDGDGMNEVIAKLGSGGLALFDGERLAERIDVEPEWVFAGGDVAQQPTAVLTTSDGVRGLIVREEVVDGERLRFLDASGTARATSVTRAFPSLEIMTGDFHRAPGEEVLLTSEGESEARIVLLGVDLEAGGFTELWDRDDQVDGSFGVGRFLGAIDVTADGFLDPFYNAEGAPIRIHDGRTGDLLTSVANPGDRVPLISVSEDESTAIVWSIAVTLIRAFEIDLLGDELAGEQILEVAPPGEIDPRGCALADVDGDGTADLIAPSRTERRVLALSGATGDALWDVALHEGDVAEAAVTPPFAGRASYVVVGDIDGDDEREVVVGSDDGYLYAIDASTAEHVWSIALSAGVATGVGFDSAEPIIADLDGDGRAEIVVATDDSRIVSVVDVGLPAPAAVAEVDSPDDESDDDIDLWAETNRLIVAWSPVLEAEGYRVSLRTSEGTTVVEWTDVGDVTTHELTELTLRPGRDYFAVVQAYRLDGRVSEEARSDGLSIGDRNAPMIRDLEVGPRAFNPETSGVSVSAQMIDETGLEEVSVRVADESGVEWSEETIPLEFPLIYLLDTSWDGRDGDGAAVPDGLYLLTVQAVDVDGQDTSRVTSLTVDTIAPAPPRLLPVGDEDGHTEETRPIIDGSAEAGTEVRVSVDGEQICAVEAMASGMFTCTSPASLGLGRHVASAVAIDSAGNASEPSEPSEFEIVDAEPDVGDDAEPRDDADARGDVTDEGDGSGDVDTGNVHEDLSDPWGGCQGCATGGGSAPLAPWAFLLLPLLAMLRRRR